MRRLLLLAVLLASPALAATGQRAGVAVEADVSNRKVTSTGGTTAKPLKDWIAGLRLAVAYGVKCDGTTDDSAAIQAAVDADPFVQLPSGVCRLVSQVTVPSGHSIRGAGMWATRIEVAGAFNGDGAFKANGTGGPPTTFSDFALIAETGGAGPASIGLHAAANGESIERLWVGGFFKNIVVAATDVVVRGVVSDTSISGATGIVITSPSVTVSDTTVYGTYVGLAVNTAGSVDGSVTISNVRANQNDYAGFTIVTSANVQIENCAATHINTGMLSHAGLLVSASTDVVVTNFLARLGGSGYHAGAYGVRLEGANNGIVLSGVNASGFERGVSVDAGTSISITGSRASGNGVYGFRVAGSDRVTLSGNQAIANGTAGAATDAGFSLSSTAGYAIWTVTGNQAQQNGGGVQDYGFHVTLTDNGGASGYINSVGNAAHYNAVSNYSNNGLIANISSTGNL